MNRFFVKPLMIAAATVLILASSNALAGRAKFTCEGSKDETCYFVIVRFDNSGTQAFTMTGGESDWVGGLRKEDEFCQSKENTPDPAECNREPLQEYED